MDRGFKIGLFRKETLTGLSTNNNIAEPNLCKFNLFQSLITRAYKNFANSSMFNSEISFFWRYFVQKRFSLCTS